MIESRPALRRQTYIVNPVAGRRRWGRWETIIAQLRRTAPDAEILVSLARGEATALAQARSDDADRVVIAVGGDGTVHELGGALVGAAAALGVLPTGSGNDFASMIAVPADVGSAAEFFARQPLRRCDVGRVEWIDHDGAAGRAFFINSLGLGFEGAVAARAERFGRVPGGLRYLLAVARELPLFCCPHLSLDCDGEALDGRQLLVAVGNGQRAGGGFLLNPGARIDDGWLDVCRADDLPLHRLLRILPSVFRGGHLDFAGVHGGRCRNLHIQSEPPTPVHADGEILTHSAVSIDISIIAGGLNLIG
ncbi:MAG: diacylglycerol/lipid kinase family protein [Wenzhouxiangella sp.]